MQAGHPAQLGLDTDDCHERASTASRTVVEIHPTVHFQPTFYCMYIILQ